MLRICVIRKPFSICSLPHVLLQRCFISTPLWKGRKKYNATDLYYFVSFRSISWQNSFKTVLLKIHGTPNVSRSWKVQEYRLSFIKKNKTGILQKVKKQDWYHEVILKFPAKQVDLLSVRLDFWTWILIHFYSNIINLSNELKCPLFFWKFNCILIR